MHECTCVIYKQLKLYSKREITFYSFICSVHLSGCYNKCNQQRHTPQSLLLSLSVCHFKYTVGFIKCSRCLPSFMDRLSPSVAKWAVLTERRCSGREVGAKFISCSQTQQKENQLVCVVLLL